MRYFLFNNVSPAAAYGGAASIYITGGLAAYLGGGSAILSGGYQMYSSVNKRTNVTKDVIQELVNKDPWTHNALK